MIMFKRIGVLLLAVIIYAFFWNSASDSRFQACTASSQAHKRSSAAR